MARARLPLGISICFVTGLLLRLACSFERLPPRMATHFDLAGVPNGFDTRVEFAWISVALSGSLLALFSALPALLRHTPNRFINLPNKDYWLLPARRQATVARLGGFCDWLGCATLALLVAMFELVIRANLLHHRLGSEIWILLIGYHLFMLVWIVSLIRSFRRPHGA